MDEATIAQRLQATMQKPEPVAPPQPVTDELVDRGFVDEMNNNVNVYKLYDYFNIEPNLRNSENEERLIAIYKWAADKAQSTDYVAVANVLTAYSQNMGAGNLNTNNLYRMWQYVQLDGQIRNLRQEQGMLYA